MFNAVKNEAVGTYNFATRDAWKGEAWQQLGTVLERAAPGNLSAEGALFRLHAAEGISTTIAEMPEWNAEQWGEATGTLALSLVGTKGLGNVGKLKTLSKIAGVTKESSTIYRAVSKAELDDITRFGLRNKSGAYETGKLFAPTAREAARFGRNNFMLDGLPSTIMKVRVPNSVLNSAYRFGADGMNAISIPENQLYRLKATPLNYSPLLK